MRPAAFNRGPSTKPDMKAVDLAARESDFGQKGVEARAVMALGQLLQPTVRDDAILAHERHHVGERADRGDLDEVRQQGDAVPVGRREERLHELQRHAHAGQDFFRIRTVGTLRVDHGERRRQRRVGLMMVGHDQIDAEFPRTVGCLGGANAAVHRDHERGARRVQPLDRGRLKTIAVLDTVRHEVGDVPTNELDRTAENHGGGDPIHVIVPVDGDSFASAHGGENAIDRAPHVGQEKWIVQLPEIGLEKGARRRRLAKSALTQQARHDRRDAHRRGKRPHVVIVRRNVFPDASQHQAARLCITRPAPAPRSAPSSVSVKLWPIRPMSRNFA